MRLTYALFKLKLIFDAQRKFVAIFLTSARPARSSRLVSIFGLHFSSRVEQVARFVVCLFAQRENQ